MFSDNLYSDRIFNTWEKFERKLRLEVYPMSKKRGKNQPYYINVPCAFDIETTSFIQNDVKMATMYIWQFGFNGLVYVGRTWEQYIEFITRFTEYLQLNYNDLRLICVVHNLGFDFEFFRKWFEWDKVFSIDTHTPIYAICMNGIEYRCSYLLSGYSLEKVGEHLQKYHIKKLVGNLDYTKIRHSKTPLTWDEIQYCVNDVKVQMAYIQELLEQYNGDWYRIPLTKTGFVRQYCRDNCFAKNDKKDGKRKRIAYINKMHNLGLTVDEYKQAKRAFQGGFTHSNPFYTGKVIENVHSIDFTSSYPYVMLSEKFPMKLKEIKQTITKSELEHYTKYYSCLFDVEFTNLQCKFWYDYYLSVSRCYYKQNYQSSNGRLVRADVVRTTITDTDYEIIKRCYKWDKIAIKDFRVYYREYLPTPFIKSILKLYRDKTELKGVEGKEVEYLNSKEMVNSCYGMTVTDICREEITYTNNEWGKQSPNYEKAIDDYNKSYTRFTSYLWGIWVTAYARRNLWTGILAINHDYIYSDTDSIKFKNLEKHKKYIDWYNSRVLQKLDRACKYHGISITDTAPKTITGKAKQLGVWDYEGMYTKFKTQGAKRYITETKIKRHGFTVYKISITVAGLNKKKGAIYLLQHYDGKLWEEFKDGLYIPPDETGKMTHTYINDELHTILTDYNGKTAEIHEKSYIHLKNCEYNLGMADEFTRYLLEIKQSYI